MADLVINDAKGRIAEIVGDGANLQLIPCSALVIDETVRDGNATPDITAFFAVVGNTEAVGSTWVRKAIANGSITLSVNDTTNLVQIVVPDPTWTAVAAANDTVALVLCEDTATDGTDRVLAKYDFAVTTDGNDVTGDTDGVNGVWSST